MSSEENQTVKVTLKDFLLRYVRYLPLFILSVGLALFLAFLYLRYTIPIYNARATLLIKTSAQSATNSNVDNLFFNSARSNVSNEIEILKSLNLSKRVAASLGLQKRSYTKGKVKTALNYPTTPIDLDIIKLNDSLNPLA